VITSDPFCYMWAPIPIEGSPGKGIRHAFRGWLNDFAEGDPAITLCTNKVTFTKNGDWFWPTCRACWQAAKLLQAKENELKDQLRFGPDGGTLA
jgi:zinc-finger